MTYVVEVAGKRDSDEGYSWVNYKAPKLTFLTKKLANEHAKSIRNRYNCRTRVTTINSLSE